MAQTFIHSSAEVESLNFNVSTLILALIASFALQTDDVVVDELRGRNHFVPLTLIREKGTYGTVTVNFQVRRIWNIPKAFLKQTEPKHSTGVKKGFVIKMEFK